MFAIECSNPAATNAEIGNIIPNILSLFLFQLCANRTQRHTSILHNVHRHIACINQ